MVNPGFDSCCAPSDAARANLNWLGKLIGLDPAINGGPGRADRSENVAKGHQLITDVVSGWWITMAGILECKLHRGFYPLGFGRPKEYHKKYSAPID
jgi:hypothetical protein